MAGAADDEINKQESSNLLGAGVTSDRLNGFDKPSVWLEFNQLAQKYSGLYLCHHKSILSLDFWQPATLDRVFPTGPPLSS